MTKVNRELTANEIRAEENALMDFQFAIIDALSERELTQAEFAEMLGVSRARVSQMLSSEANPTIKLVGRALAALGLAADYCAVEKSRAKKQSGVEFEYEENLQTEVDDSALRWFAHQHLRASNVWSQPSAPVGANSNSPETWKAA
jgi:transcriptional regulator with XRE-family HTH domain